jgi:UDP-glucose 4-epimerase
MMRAVVTGAAGFIGAHLVRRLLSNGHEVVAVDSMVRGIASRLPVDHPRLRLEQIDIRSLELVRKAVVGADVVFHLAAINGTENFYSRPQLVLDVGIKGALAVAEACIAESVPDMVMASSAEVYQSAAVVPTPETTALSLPDSLNPRYSYGGSKIATELIAFNYGIEHFRKVQVFRPHNVYGADMGWKHVIPQFIARAAKLGHESNNPIHDFPIQGDGEETRAFCYVEDVVDGILCMYDKGATRQVYHIGNDEEVSIRQLALLVGSTLGRTLSVVPGPLSEGGTRRRCPDISRLRSLGWEPRTNLQSGLVTTCAWYLEHLDAPPDNKLL